MSPTLLEAITEQKHINIEEQALIDTRLTNGTEEQVTENSLIVLVQLISTRAVVAEETSPSNAIQTVNLSGGVSVHRLHAMVLNGDVIKLYPCVFKSSLSKSSAFMRKKQLAKWALPDFEGNSTEEEETKALCYKSKVISQKTIELARKIQKAFRDNYLA